MPLPLIGAKDAKAVEDRSGVQKCSHDSAGAQLGAAEPILELDRKLPHLAVAKRICDREQLEVESELLDEKQRKHVFHDRASEDLQTDLRITNIEAEQQSVQ